MSIIEAIKGHDFIYNYRRIWPFVKPYWKLALLSILIGIPVGALDAAVALFLKPYTDSVITEDVTRSPWYIPFLIVGFTLIQGILLYVGTYLNAYVGAKISMSIKKHMYKKLIYSDPAFFDERNSGTILMRFAGDPDTATGGLIRNLKNLVTRVFSSLALIGVLFYNSWQLSIVAVIILFLAVLPLAYVKKLMKKIANKQIELSGDLTTDYTETYLGNRTIAAYNMQEKQTSYFSGNLDTLFNLSMRITRRTTWLSPVMHLIISIGLALAVAMGGWLISTDTMTTGSFVSFIAALLLLYTPLKTMGNTIVGIQSSFIAMERLFELMDMQPKIVNKPDAIRDSSFDQSIQFENVSFSYKKEKSVLKNVSFEVKKGETLAIVGNSGGGKSTLVSLIPRFYDVSGGAIKIDGTDIRDMDLVTLRDNISVVFQDNFLFRGSIRDNITCAKEDATEEMIKEAVELACLKEFIDELPDGLESSVGEQGTLLSGGQKQRVAIARAFLKNAPIIILDEATSSLDNKSEKIVQQAIDNLMAHKTVFVIAHRLSTIHDADRIAVIHEGNLVELGPHKELILIENGVYKQLHDMQFRTEEANTNTVGEDYA